MTSVLQSYLKRNSSSSKYGCQSQESQKLCANDILKLQNEIEQQFKPTKCHVPFKNYKKLNWKWDASEQDNEHILLTQMHDAVMFHPARSFCTTGLRTDCPLKRNAYTYWQVTISDRVFGSSIMVGIGRRQAQTKSTGFLNLLGSDDNSWGLSHKGLLWHNNESKRYCNDFDENKAVKIGCLFNGFNGELAYFVNDVYMGIGYRHIPLQQDLYAMVSSTVSKCCMRLDFCYQTFPSLQETCRLRLIENKTIFNSIRMQYPYLPRFIEHYLED